MLHIKIKVHCIEPNFCSFIYCVSCADIIQDFNIAVNGIPNVFTKKHAFLNEFLSNKFNSQNRHLSDTQQQKAQYQPSEERIRR